MGLTTTSLFESKRSTSGSKVLAIGINASALIFIVVQAYAAYRPSATNWGIHHLAFFSPEVRSLALVLMMLFLIPRIQVFVLRGIGSLAGTFLLLGKSKQIGVSIILFVFTLVLFWSVREATYLLGDGALILRSMSKLQPEDLVSTSFRNEPLAGLLLWNAWQLCLHWTVFHVERFAIQALNIFAGGITLILIYNIVLELVAGIVDRLLLFAFIVAGGASQLFFGYVESYTLLYAGLVLFVWLSLRYLNGKGHLVLPSLAFGLLFTIHFSMLIMIPALVALYVYCIRHQRKAEIPSAIFGLVALVIVILWMCGYSVSFFFDVLLHSQHHFLLFEMLTSARQGYSLISRGHFFDIVNLQLLLSPFALVAILLLIFHQKIFLFDTSFIFLFIVAGCGIAFSAIVSLDLGMSRDWDVLATYSVGILICAGYAWLHYLNDSMVKRCYMILMVSLMILNTGSFIAVNASEERSVSRFQVLPDAELWGRTALTAAYEELAIFYRERKDYVNAFYYFKQFLVIDSSNGRLWASLGDLYHYMDDDEGAIVAYKKAVMLSNAKSPTYVVEAIANCRLGALMIQENKPCSEALPYILRALKLDPTNSDAQFNAGMCYYEIKNFTMAKRHLQQFLALQPNLSDVKIAKHTLDSIRE